MNCPSIVLVCFLLSCRRGGVVATRAHFCVFILHPQLPRISGGTNRIFANFHLLCRARYRRAEALDGEALARVCLAFSVMRDAEKRSLYVNHGIQGQSDTNPITSPHLAQMAPKFAI